MRCPYSFVRSSMLGYLFVKSDLTYDFELSNEYLVIILRTGICKGLWKVWIIG